jgi:hypothetical protein
MTPIQDHAYHLRQRLIRGDESAKRMHFQALVKMGVDEVEAANRSGYHHIVPIDKFLQRFGWTLVVGCTLILLGLYASTTAANMENKDKVQELTNLEQAVYRCMKGQPMMIGQEWFKCTCLSSDDPKGCPEEAK